MNFRLTLNSSTRHPQSSFLKPSRRRRSDSVAKYFFRPQHPGVKISRPQAISEIVGDGEAEGGAPCVVYRALRRLLCEACGSVIGEGELFTRRQVPGQRLRIMPRCRRCAPFTPEGEGAKRRPGLLDALMLSRPPAAQTPTTSDPEKVAEAVERRLGPALARGRRNRRT